MNRIRIDQSAGHRAREVELERVTRELDRYVDAIGQGVPPVRVKDKMIELEARRAELMADGKRPKEPVPYLHPNKTDG